MLWLAPAVLLVGALTYLPILTGSWLKLLCRRWIFDAAIRRIGELCASHRAAGFLGSSVEQCLVRDRHSFRETDPGADCGVAAQRLIPRKSLFRAVFFLPVILSFVAIGLLWTLIFNYNYGLINFLLQSVGLADLKRDWLGAPETAFPAVIFVDLWKWTGFHVVIYLAGLQSIPSDLYEAAALDGASRWQMLWRITLPLLKPFTAVNVVIASLGAFSVFDLIYVMTQGGPFKSTNVAMIEVYLQAFQFNQFGYAAALSALVLLLNCRFVVWLVANISLRCRRPNSHGQLDTKGIESSPLRAPLLFRRRYSLPICLDDLRILEKPNRISGQPSFSADDH